MKVEPYLFFNGRCEEAMAFYKEAIGAEVTFQMRMSEAPEQPPPGAIPEGFGNKIMHANLRIGSTMLMVSDGNSNMQPTFNGFTLSLSLADAAEAERTFNARAATRRRQGDMPLGKTFWSPPWHAGRPVWRGLDGDRALKGSSMSFQAYLDNIQTKTGKSPDDFREMAEQRDTPRTDGFAPT
jgi:PhnB protein